MSSGWHWFVIAGTVLSLAGALWLLFSNRNTSGEETTGHVWDGIEELDNPLPMWWVWMFVGTVVFAIAYLIYYPGLGNAAGAGSWSSQEQYEAEAAAHEARFAPLYQQLAGLTEAELVDSQRAMQVGRRLFVNHCAACHGVNGAGAYGFPNLTDSEWMWGDGFGDIKTTILGGRMGIMAPWGAALGDDGVRDTAHYVRSMAGLDHDAGLAEAGAQHFGTFCVACHQADGKGNKLLGAPDLTNDIWLYGSSLEEISFTIRHGRNNNMPAHADVLGKEKAHILAGYVTTLSE